MIPPGVKSMSRDLLPDRIIDGFDIPYITESFGFRWYGIEDCPMPQMRIFDVMVNWPSILPVAIVGLTIGFLVSLGLAVLLFSNNKNPTLYSYFWAFFFFGCMNTDAILLHCFGDRTTNFVQKILLALDAFFTGASAFSLFWASLVDTKFVSSSKILLNSYFVLFAAAAAAYVVYDLPIMTISLYTYVTLFSVTLFLIVEVIFGKNGGSFNFWMFMAFFVMCLGLVSVAFNGYICENFGPHLSCSTLWFVACDIGYLFVMLMWAYQQETQYEKKDEKKRDEKKEEKKKEEKKQEQKKEEKKKEEKKKEEKKEENKKEEKKKEEKKKEEKKKEEKKKEEKQDTKKEEKKKEENKQEQKKENQQSKKTKAK